MHIDIFIFDRMFGCKYFFIKLHVIFRICEHDANNEKIRGRSAPLETF